MIVALVVLAVVAAGVYIVSGFLHDPLTTFFLKALASFSFIVLFAGVVFEKFLIVGSPHYLGQDFAYQAILVSLFLLGLVSGLIGDLVLELLDLRENAEHDKIILAGIIAFFTGHIFYYMALLAYGKFSIYPLIFTMVVTALVFGASKFMKLNWGKCLWPSVAYSLLIFLMIGQAFANAVADGFSGFSLTVLIGGTLFGISDLLLSQIYFKDHSPRIFKVLNLSTYYAAQILLALSLLFIV
ncbi:MAG: hypothetical protein JXR38_01170 [Bacilli bacterium]|nr:hypothetical protein [Bacilli bacterium]